MAYRKRPKILIACEFSGVVREAFRARKFNAWSCDVMSSEIPSPYHLQCDIREVINEGWDLVIAHPPCTYLTVSGLHWNRRIPEREEKTKDSLDFIEFIWNCNAKHLCMENPVGCINSRIPSMPKPQYVQPYEFGDDASKKTGLWLRGLPKLNPTKRVKGRIVNGKERWANQTDSGQNRLGPSPERSKERGRTYKGIAQARAQQWGDYLIGLQKED